MKARRKKRERGTKRLLCYTGSNEKKQKGEKEYDKPRKAQKRCLKGLFPNINFSEKFRYKKKRNKEREGVRESERTSTEPSFVNIHNVTLFYVFSLFASQVISSIAVNLPLLPSRKACAFHMFVLKRKKCHFDTFEIFFFRFLSFWFHPQHYFHEYTRQTALGRGKTTRFERGKVFLSWLTSYFSRMLFFFWQLVSSVERHSKHTKQVKKVKRRALRISLPEEGERYESHDSSQKVIGVCWEVRSIDYSRFVRAQTWQSSKTCARYKSRTIIDKR